MNSHWSDAQQRLKCIVSYDGGAYHGFQVQPDAPSIQERIERVLSTMHKQTVKIVASGRTDAGVHAKGQVFHFDTHMELTGAQWVKALNAQLPEDIRISQVQEVHRNFHARYDARKKEYRYYVYPQTIMAPFSRHYSYHIPYPLDEQRMEEGVKLLIGEHDFSAFSSAKSEVEDKVRQIYRLEWVREGRHLVMICEGNGFLYNMVRILAGTLIDMGRGKLTLNDIQQALEQKERRLAGHTAPAHGLFLWRVHY